MPQDDLGREEVVIHSPLMITVINRTDGLVSSVEETDPAGRKRTSTITRDGDGMVTQIQESFS